MLRYAMLAITMLPTCLVAQQATEDEVIAECVKQTERTELMIKAFSQIEDQGETMGPSDIGHLILNMEVNANLEKMIVQIAEKQISPDDVYQLFNNLYEEREGIQNRIEKLAEALKEGPLEVAEAKTDMIVHCISANKK